MLESTFPPDCHWEDVSLRPHTICAYNYSSLMSFSYSNEIHHEEIILFEKKRLKQPNVQLNWNVLVKSKSLSFILVFFSDYRNKLVLHWIVYFSSFLTKRIDICFYELRDAFKKEQIKLVLLYATNHSLAMILTKATCARSYYQSDVKDYIQVFQPKLLASMIFKIINV